MGFNSEFKGLKQWTELEIRKWKIVHRNMQGMYGHIACRPICCTRGGSSFRTLALHCYAPSARSPVDWPHEVIEPMFTTRGPARGESTLHCMRGRCVRHCEPECVCVCVCVCVSVTSHRVQGYGLSYLFRIQRISGFTLRSCFVN